MKIFHDFMTSGGLEIPCVARYSMDTREDE